MRLRILLLPVLILLLPDEASAHVGIHGPAGLVGGLVHPFTGFDHILAMLAVGMWAGWLGGKLRWAIPAGFVTAAAAGFLLGLGGSEISALVEQGIALSLVGLGGLLFFRARLSPAVGLPLVAAFGLFHGLAHGSEMAKGSSEWLFMAGFLTSTAVLHLAGILLGMVRMQNAVLRLGGAGIAATGMFLVTMNLS